MNTTIEALDARIKALLYSRDALTEKEVAQANALIDERKTLRRKSASSSRSAASERNRFREAAKADRVGFSYAVHEAGHFVSAYVCGLSIGALDVIADEKQRGESSISGPANDDQRLQWMAGGIAAEIELLGVHRSEFLLSGDGDLRLAAKILHDVPPPYSTWSVMQSPTFTRAMWSARDAIAAAADTTRFLACELAEKKVLSGRQCEDLFLTGLSLFGERAVCGDR